LAAEGIFAVVVGGTFLHFIYEWSRRWLLLATVAPVNESVWDT
jgi:hypothetical protein